MLWGYNNIFFSIEPAECKLDFSMITSDDHTKSQSDDNAETLHIVGAFIGRYSHN